MGATGERTIDLLEREGVLAPGGFVGIDLDPARIDGFRRFRPDLKWVAGNLYERLETHELANVGVLNLDAYGEVGDVDGLGDFHLIRGLALRGVERFGESPCSGIRISTPSRAGGARRGLALRRHAEMVCRALQGCLPRRELAPAMLLPEGGDEMIESGFVGVLGAFEIYRGKKNGHRMANLRLILR